MSYTVPYFKNLIETYPTWPQMEAYLTSVNVRITGTSEDRYRILKLQPSSTITDKWLRSVVWDTHTHRPTCVAPPKAETTEVPAGNVSFRLIQDFLDGTMINAFRCLDVDGVQIATRSQMGASGTFYSQKTFAQMFQEACKVPLESLIAQPLSITPTTFVSFVLQHPEHRVVSRTRYPKLYAVHEGCINQDGLVYIQELSNGWSSDALAAMAPPCQPMNGFRSSADLDSFFTSLTGSHGWFWQGLVFKDGEGRRWKMRNPNYMYLRDLRGSESSSEERFLRLRASGKVTEYLKHFSEERDLFWGYEHLLRAQTQCVYMAYVDVHKLRTKKLGDVSKVLQPFVFRLHSKFLESAAAGTKVSITMKETIELVNVSPMFEKKRLLTTPLVAVAPVASLAVAGLTATDPATDSITEEIKPTIEISVP